MGDFSDSQKGQIMGTSLAGASLILTALFHVLRITVFMIMTAHIKHDQTLYQSRIMGKKTKVTDRDH